MNQFIVVFRFCWVYMRTGWWWYVGLRLKKCQEIGDNFTMRSFMVCTLHQLLLLLFWSSIEEWDGQAMRYEGK